MKELVWVCENPEYMAEYAEYVNGCPKCHEGRLAQGLFPLYFSVREHEKESK